LSIGRHSIGGFCCWDDQRRANHDYPSFDLRYIDVDVNIDRESSTTVVDSDEVFLFFLLLLFLLFDFVFAFFVVLESRSDERCDEV